MKNVWINSRTDYFLGESSAQVFPLPIGVYKIMMDPHKVLYLTKVDDQFFVPSKIYGAEQNFVTRVIRSYGQTEDNLGILLNGIKGTGKTLTAMQICNLLKLPVLIVPAYYEGLNQFLNDIRQEVVVFFDEYEKIYDGKDGRSDNAILNIMDGALKGNHRKVFLLTTNELSINEYMLQRPGRIRYVKTFKDLKHEVISEILDDLLVNKLWKDDCMEVISSLSIITIDLVKSIVQEVNIHNESPKEFIEVFNVKGNQNQRWDLFRMADGKEELFRANTDLNIRAISHDIIGNMLSDRENFYGRIIGIKGDNILKVDTTGYEESEDNDEEDSDVAKTKVRTIRNFRIEPATIFHRYYNPAI